MVQAFDDQQARAAIHRGSAVGENFFRALVVPVVDDRREYIGVASGRNRIEEASRHDFASIGDTGLLEPLARTGNDRWQIEQHGAQMLLLR